MKKQEEQKEDKNTQKHACYKCKCVILSQQLLLKSANVNNFWVSNQQSQFVYSNNSVVCIQKHTADKLLVLVPSHIAFKNEWKKKQPSWVRMLHWLKQRSQVNYLLSKRKTKRANKWGSAYTESPFSLFCFQKLK